MRWFICALVVLALPPRAFAGDFDILRGSQSVGPANFSNWSGFYAGGQVGYGDASGDFSRATASIVSDALRVTTLEDEFSPSSWSVLGNATQGAWSYGGFVGYNSQWQDLVLGVEANYNQSKYALTAPISPIGRITPADSDGNSWTVAFTGAGTVTDLDYGSLRARAGLVLGNFLPYGFAGVALGQATISVSSTGYAVANLPASGPCSSTNSPPCYLLEWNQTNSQNYLIYGFVVGGGLDVALTQNIFLRGEFEYAQFAPVSDVVLSVISGHVGAGIKF
jgi:opacity protein-like surface antigen